MKAPPGAEVPDRGNVIWISLSPQAGHEQAGRRPALVLSPADYNGRLGLALMCPITSQVKGYPFEVAIPPGLPIGGVILSDQIKCLDWRVRRAERICIMLEETIEQVLSKLAALLPGIAG